MLVDGTAAAVRGTVYGLVDPLEPNRVRYVGKARQPAARLAHHLRERPGIYGPTEKHLWIADLVDAGRYPNLVQLEIPKPGAIGRERWWFDHLRANGQADLNVFPPQRVEDFPPAELFHLSLAGPAGLRHRVYKPRSEQAAIRREARKVAP